MSTETEERPRVFLNSVHLKGFKSIEDLAIDLKKGLNILIGKNGAGKSNFMEAIDLIIRSKGQSKIPYKYAQIEIISEDNQSFIVEREREVHLKIEKENLSDKLDVIEKITINGEVAFDNSNNEDLKRRFSFKNKRLSYGGNLAGLFIRLGYKPVFTSYIKFNIPDDLEAVDVPGTLKFNTGDEYAEWKVETMSFVNDIFWNLENLYYDEDQAKKLTIEDFNNQIELQDAIVTNLARFTNIENLRFNTNINIYSTEKFSFFENIKLEFKVNGNWLPWSQLSDGTQRLFYIIAEVTNATGQVLIEEPELGIHPHQFNLLMDFLKEQSEDKQIIISTHSPKALDHLSPEELDHILIAYYDLDKGTQIRHLSDKEIKKAQRYMKEVGYFSDYWMYSDLE